LSRRLGDDPLTRARSERAKATAGSAPIVIGSGEQDGTAQVGIQSASRASYNDVFFQRRGEDIAPLQAAANAPGAPEAPEISEISQIPEIREAAAASGSLATFDATPDSKATSFSPQDAQVVRAPTVSIVEEVVAKLNGADTGTASTAVTPPQGKEEPSPPTAPQGPANGSDQSNPEPQKSGGFFKRLFGKFK
jgi:hypothetical protein